MFKSIDIGNFTINVSYWDQYHTDTTQKGTQNYTVVNVR